MRKLSEYNEDLIKNVYRLEDKHRNGIACDNCGEELFDSSPFVTLMSYPAKKEVHCEKCGFNGYRVA